MASRDRIHRSSINRRRGPTHTRDYPVAGGKKRRAEDGIVSPEYDRKTARRNEEIEQQNRHAPGIGRKRLAEGDYYRESYWDAEEFQESRPPHNNYDDYDRIYPPSQGG